MYVYVQYSQKSRGRLPDVKRQVSSSMISIFTEDHYAIDPRIAQISLMLCEKVAECLSKADFLV
jgi:hypothetical protein